MIRCSRWEPNHQHFEICRALTLRMDMLLVCPSHSYLLEAYGDATAAVQFFERQQAALHGYLKVSAKPSTDVPCGFLSSPGALVGRETDSLHPFRPALVRLLGAFGCFDCQDCVTWYEDSAEWQVVRKRVRSSRDGKHHAWYVNLHVVVPRAEVDTLLSFRTKQSYRRPVNGIKAILQALISLASAETSSSVAMDWLDTLQSPESSTLYISNISQWSMVCPRTLVAESLEQEGRLEDAIAWATCNLEDEFNFNTPGKHI